jgi:uncharacterized protein (TIGR00288 family)
MPKVMLLIDADNLSADVITQAVATVLAEHGAAHVRRAYCTAESAVKNQALFKKLLIRPVVNLSVGKNATDILLAVDAIDLVVGERPDVVVIASSDSDFAPLVMRLREKGCRVCGIGQQGKTGDEAPQAYDQFTVLSHGRRSATAKAPAVKEPAAERPVRAPRRRAVAQAAPAKVALPDEVQQILQAVPELAGGSAVALNLATEKLRAAKLLAKSASSTRFFKKHESHFELAPERQPNHVRFSGS